MNAKQKVDSLITKKSILIGVGILASLGIGYFGYKIFLGNKSARQLYKYIQMIDTIQLANEEAAEALQTLVIEKTVSVKQGKLQMLFNLITKLNNKINRTQGALKNPFIPPFEPGIFICQLEPNHRLLFNKYNIYRNHLLVVTKEFQSQLTRLSLGDFEQTIYIYKTIDGFFFFNRGPNSGASQPHKHIQVFPSQAKKLPIFREMKKFAQQRNSQWDLNSQQIQIERFPDFKFLHGIVAMPGNKKTIKDRRRFAQYMKKAENALYRALINEFTNVDYNVIGCDEFLFMVPRKKQKAFEQLSVNSVGFMGSLLFRSQVNMKKFENLGIKPRSILQDVTFQSQLKQALNERIQQ